MERLTDSITANTTSITELQNRSNIVRVQEAYTTDTNGVVSLPTNKYAIGNFINAEVYGSLNNINVTAFSYNTSVYLLPQRVTYSSEVVSYQKLKSTTLNYNIWAASVN